MKEKKTPFRFIRGVFGLVFDNWGLKILAIVLAIVIYYSMKPKSDQISIPGGGERSKFEKTDSNGKTATP